MSIFDSGVGGVEWECDFERLNKLDAFLPRLLSLLLVDFEDPMDLLERLSSLASLLSFLSFSSSFLDLISAGGARVGTAGVDPAAILIAGDRKSVV